MKKTEAGKKALVESYFERVENSDKRRLVVLFFFLPGGKNVRFFISFDSCIKNTKSVDFIFIFLVIVMPQLT